MTEDAKPEPIERLIREVTRREVTRILGPINDRVIALQHDHSRKARRSGM